jgi:hypothetical protein
MSLEWNKLRPWGKDNSRNGAFEALCCQLAEYEQVPAGSHFVRKAAPDAGLECYWRLADGSEKGWQAKFFTSIPEEAQWNQIDASVKKAIAKHPKLTELIVCLPLDRPDPRIPNQEWFMDAWDSRVQKWCKWVEAIPGRDVAFRYWGDHEIFERLSREEHHGRQKFWFDAELLSQKWLEKRWDEARASAGPRYSPELNVRLSIARVFGALGRTEAFDSLLSKTEALLRKAARSLQKQSAKLEDRQPLLSRLQDELSALAEGFRAVVADPFAGLPGEAFVQRINTARQLTWDLMQHAGDLKEKDGETSRDVSQSKSGHDPLEFLLHSLHHASNALSEALDVAEGDEGDITAQRTLCLTGDAGSGKTHLLCDVARGRLDRGEPTILILGQRFTSPSEPVKQMLDLLQLDTSQEDFLGALDAAAQAAGRRALILIDALNEGAGRIIWPAHLSAFLTSIRKYRRLAVAVSVRSSYQTAIFPDGQPNDLPLVEHTGFGDAMYDALRSFFDHYGIAEPSVPLLNPEFNNPLFLKLLCEGLKNAGEKQIPSGWHGITYVFSFFTEALNSKLSGLGLFNPKTKIVRKAALQLAKAMADAKRRWLDIESA